MSSGIMVCLLCLEETSHLNDEILIFGESDVAKNARNIIVKYFWFDVSHFIPLLSFIRYHKVFFFL